MSDARTQLVRTGYDTITDDYLAWTAQIEDDPKVMYVDQLGKRVASGDRVLELGCGAGEQCTRMLAEHFEVTGVDISQEQLSRARARISNAHFVQADLTELELEPQSYGAVVAIYVLNHVPRELLGDLLRRIAGSLKPGGHLLASFGIADEREWAGHWLGTTMFFSSFPAETNSRLVGEAGFVRLLDEVATIREPEGDATFQWIIAER